MVCAEATHYTYPPANSSCNAHVQLQFLRFSFFFRESATHTRLSVSNKKAQENKEFQGLMICSHRTSVHSNNMDHVQQISSVK